MMIRSHCMASAATALLQQLRDTTQAVEGTLETHLGEVIRQMEHQGRLIEWIVTWRFGLVFGLIGACMVSIVLLWVRLSRLAAVDEPVAAVQEAGGPLPATPVPGDSDRVQAAQREAIPRVVFLSGVIDRLVRGVQASLRRRGGVETGYALVGTIAGEGRDRILTVRGLIDEGAAADCSAGRHRADRVYQQEELCLLQMSMPDLMHIGDAHLHPGSMDRCSAGDRRTDQGNVLDSRSQEMVFVILTAAAAQRCEGHVESMVRDGLKLDFYYMGKASGYEYRPFRPEIRGGELAIPCESLRRFMRADPIRARLDFDNLWRLTDYTMNVIQLPDGEGRSRPCIEMTHRRHGFRTMVVLPSSPARSPEVLVDTGTEMAAYEPAYLQQGYAGVAWFTAIVLDVEREVIGRQAAKRHRIASVPMSGRSAPIGKSVIGPGRDGNGHIQTFKPGTGPADPAGDGTQPVGQ